MAEMSTKEKLQFAALELFSKKGYAATSVDEIAESVGMKGPIIYKYFKGKEDLLHSLINITDGNYRQEMMIETAVPVWIHNGAELKEFSLHQIDNIIDLFSRIFKCMIDNGAVDPADPEILALEYTSPTSVLIQLCDREPDRKEEALKLIEKHIDFFISKYCKK